MIFFKPFILLIGGNIGNEPSNEVWSLSIDKSPFYWNRLSLEGNMPSPWVYHAVSIWKSPKKGDMVLLFGGWDSKSKALNDLWGLRRHKNGLWDWILAPHKEGIPPISWY